MMMTNMKLAQNGRLRNEKNEGLRNSVISIPRLAGPAELHVGRRWPQILRAAWLSIDGGRCVHEIHEATPRRQSIDRFSRGSRPAAPLLIGSPA
jgi:hypothetical protein